MLPGTLTTRSCSAFSLRACWRLLNAPDMSRERELEVDVLDGNEHPGLESREAAGRLCIALGAKKKKIGYGIWVG